MDDLLVDLDKVLDDFEAEELTSPSAPGQEIKPSGYAQYIAAHEDRPWEGMSEVPVNDGSPWKKGMNMKQATMPISYDIPYEPGEKFDMSEADFAPSPVTNSFDIDLDKAGDKLDLIDGKLSPVSVTANDIHAVNENHAPLSPDNYKVPVQVTDDVYSYTESPADERNGLTFPNMTKIVPGIEIGDLQGPRQKNSSDNQMGLNEVSEKMHNARQNVLATDDRVSPTKDNFVNTTQSVPISTTGQTGSVLSDNIYHSPNTQVVLPSESHSVMQDNYISSSCQRVLGGFSTSNVASDKESTSQEPLAEGMTAGDKMSPVPNNIDDGGLVCKNSNIPVDNPEMTEERKTTPSDQGVAPDGKNNDPMSMQDFGGDSTESSSDDDSLNHNNMEQPIHSQSIKTDAHISSNTDAHISSNETSIQSSENLDMPVISNQKPVVDVNESLKSDLNVVSCQPPTVVHVVGFGNFDDIEVTEDDMEKYLAESETSTDNTGFAEQQEPACLATSNGVVGDDHVNNVEKPRHSPLNEKNKLSHSITNTNSLSEKPSVHSGTLMMNGVAEDVANISSGDYVTLTATVNTNAPANNVWGLQDANKLPTQKSSEFAVNSESFSDTFHQSQDRNSAILSEGFFLDRKAVNIESNLSTFVKEPNALDTALTNLDSGNHALVCQISSKEEGSGSELSSSDQGSPQSPVSFGARPKDPSQGMKKNRPNSLLGLSKVSLDSPFNMAHTVPDAHSTAEQTSHAESVSSLDLNEILQNGPCVPDHDIVNKQIIEQNMSPKIQKSIENLDIKQRMEQDQKQRMENENVQNVDSGDLTMPECVQEVSEVVISEEGVPVEAAGAEEEVAVMRRRTKDSGLQHPQDAQVLSGPGQTRPHSWGPSGTDPSPLQKQKRPTSLSLPPRQDFNPHATDRSPPAFPFEGGEGVIQEADSAVEIEEEINPEEPEAYGASEASADHPDGHPDGLSSDPVPQTDQHSSLGKFAPRWVPDGEAAHCMGCEARFTFTKRRHHCRACGKVFCSSCCNQKSRLYYMDSKEARVCQSCHQVLAIGTQRKGEPKQVMFSDGIRPGGDLTELDGAAAARLPPRRLGRVQKKVERMAAEEGAATQRTRKLKSDEGKRNQCLIPDDGLPPVILPKGIDRDYSLEEDPDPEKFMPQIKDEEADPVIFAVNTNLFVMVKILNLDCCVNRTCWCFTTKGMCTAGQDEIVIVLECLPDEDAIPRDIFCHFHAVYEEANKGNTVTDMGHTIFNQSFLDSRDHGGFLYIRPTFQCLQKLIIPSPPYVFGILLQKWETPWAKVFPIRLLLRLGAEYRYYPCPLISVRNRKPVFFEIGHTIMNLLADFRNYQYMLPVIRGVRIHMEDKKTLIMFPRNRYDDLMKVVNNSNEHVMAMGANFSAEADSHLVCIQNDDGNYQTQAINIQNKARKVTGASFVVFNGALKSSSGLSAKSSIVEDGLMVQITPDSMVALKLAMKDMKEYTIGCGSVAVTKPEEEVAIQWVEDDKNVNIGLKSPLDNMAMDGIESIHIHNSTDYVGENRIIRWTEVFFIRNEDVGSKWEPVDLSRLAETLASACCIALTSHLDRLREASMTKIALRVTIESERVGYEIGANGEKLPDFYMNDLDDELIPVIHGAASQNHEGPIVLELVFHILD